MSCSRTLGLSWRRAAERSGPGRGRGGPGRPVQEQAACGCLGDTGTTLCQWLAARHHALFRLVVRGCRFSSGGKGSHSAELAVAINKTKTQTSTLLELMDPFVYLSLNIVTWFFFGCVSPCQMSRSEAVEACAKKTKTWKRHYFFALIVPI